MCEILARFGQAIKSKFAALRLIGLNTKIKLWVFKYLLNAPFFGTNKSHNCNKTIFRYSFTSVAC